MAKYVRRFIITINTPPGTNPDQVMKLMKEAITDVNGVLEDPAPKTYFKGIKDQSLEFDLFYWVSDNILDVQSDANLAVQKKLKQGGVKILLPQKIEIKEQTESRTGRDKTANKN